MAVIKFSNPSSAGCIGVGKSSSTNMSPAVDCVEADAPFSIDCTWSHCR